MEIRKYKDEDFSILQKWFQQYEWPECSQGSISKNAYMIWHDEVPVAFSYFVSTDCNIAHLGFILTDKTAGIRSRDIALDMLLTHIFEQVKLAGFEFIYFFTDTEAIVKRMNKLELMQVVNNSKGYKLIGSLQGASIDFFYE